MWYLIVSIPDLCTLTYFKYYNFVFHTDSITFYLSIEFDAFRFSLPCCLAICFPVLDDYIATVGINLIPEYITVIGNPKSIPG